MLCHQKQQMSPYKYSGKYRQTLDLQAIELAKSRAPVTIGHLLATRLENQDHFQIFHFAIRGMVESLAEKASETDVDQVPILHL